MSVLHFHFLGDHQPRLLLDIVLLHLNQQDWHFCLRDLHSCCPHCVHHQALLQSRDQVAKNMDPDRFFHVHDNLER